MAKDNFLTEKTGSAVVFNFYLLSLIILMD